MSVTRLRLSAAGLASCVLLIACSSSPVDGDSDGNRNEFVDDYQQGSGSSGSSSSGGPGAVCTPGEQLPCYSGPSGTEGVGFCVGGVQICNADGNGYGACEGEVVPITETCTTDGDDDCDGLSNEEGPDCDCDPGSTRSCYSGPASTKDVGICQAGNQSCNPSGNGYGACTGEVVPQLEDCTTASDEDCDGLTPPCPDGIIDIRGDNNRDGVIDFNDPADDTGEDSWDETHGAVFLANIDDDQGACPTSGSDEQLAACNDASDDYINGNDDLLDLARLQTAPWPSAPTGASGSIDLSGGASAYVRLFKKNGADFEEYIPGTTLTSSELQQGVELAVEGKDFVRDDQLWDGFIDVTLTVDDGSGAVGNDKLRMRVAPVIFRHHLDPLTTYYVTNFNYASSVAFRNDLATAATAAGAQVHNIYEDDQWTQDFIETAYMSMPTSGGAHHVIHVNFRSANYTSTGLRSAGRSVFTDLRGRDVAGAVEFDPNHSNGMDTLNSFGNTETIPPYGNWPLGRVLRGSDPQYYPDANFDAMIESQGVQGLVTIDTSWLLVGHVDESVSFVKVNSPRGWAMMVNDATMAKTMLENARDSGYGSTSMFVGKYWSGGSSAQTTIDAVLADADILNESAWAAVKVDEQVSDLKAETGITDAELIPVPFLHWESSGWSLAYQPGTVNGIYMGDQHFGAPDPHGPVIGGQDIFKEQLSTELGAYGITVHWIENWDLYHRLSGEVHCGSNATRQVPNDVKWWESGL
jgi:protein-arginine deiminase